MGTRTLMTADELLALPDDGMRHELVEGELIAMAPAGCEHGRVASRRAGLLWRFLGQNPVGEPFGAETGFRIASDPDTVRAPDVAFVSKERVSEVSAPRGFGRGAPDFVAEVISPDDPYEQVELEVLQWLRAGTRQVSLPRPS